MKNKTLRVVLVAFVAIVLVVCSFGGGFAAGHFLPLGTSSTQVTSTSGNQGGTPADLTNLFAPFWEAWKIVHQEYVDQPVDDTKLMEGAISGMMQSLGDAHSTYMDSPDYKDATSQLAGSYAGIGSLVDTSGTIVDHYQAVPQFSGRKGRPAGRRPDHRRGRQGYDQSAA